MKIPSSTWIVFLFGSSLMLQVNADWFTDAVDSIAKAAVAIAPIVILAAGRKRGEESHMLINNIDLADCEKYGVKPSMKVDQQMSSIVFGRADENRDGELQEREEILYVGILSVFERCLTMMKADENASG